AEGLTKRSAVGFLLRSLIMFQTFISRHNSNFFSDKLVLTSVTPASSAPVLQTPKATSSTLYFDSLMVIAGSGGFFYCIDFVTLLFLAIIQTFFLISWFSLLLLQLLRHLFYRHLKLHRQRYILIVCCLILVMVVFFIAFRWLHMSSPLLRLFLMVLILILMTSYYFFPF